MKSTAFAAAAVLLALPASAQPLDCAALKSTDAAFVIDYQVKRVPTGGQVLPTTAETTQVIRRGAETRTYHLLDKGRFLRNRFVSPLFPSEVFISDPPVRWLWSYSIDPTPDYIARRQPVKFTAELKEPDGTVFLSTRVEVRFLGTDTVSASGCRFDAVKIRRTNDGVAQGQPLISQAETWVVPELRASLFTRVTDANFSITYTTLAISRDFKPVE